MMRPMAPGLRSIVPVAILASTLALGAVSAHAAGDNAGVAAAAFLAVPPGASGPGMAGATLALDGDLTAGATNPASLGQVRGLGLACSHSQLPDGSRHEWASVAGQLGVVTTRWGLSGLYAGQGPFEGRDALNQSTGSFTASSVAIGLALAQPLGKHAALGMATRVVNENLAGTSGTGVTFDAGMTARAGVLAIGASAQNVGGSMRYGGASYEFPTNYGIGVALEHPTGLRLEVDANFPTSYYNDVRGGVEYRWRERVALRAGYRQELSPTPSSESLNGMSFGVGAGVGGLWLDYAYLPSSMGGEDQRLGIVLHRRAQADPDAAEAKLTPRTSDPSRTRGAK